MLLDLTNNTIIACSSCSSRLRFTLYPDYRIWAWLIVIFIFGAIPMLFLLGMRCSQRPVRITKGRTLSMVIIWFFIYLFSGSPTFSGIMSGWIFFPMEIIMAITFSFPFGAILIPIYFYVMVKIMQRFDRRLYLQSGKTWQRLERMKNGKNN